MYVNFSFQPLSNPIGGFHAHAIQKNHNHSPGPFNIYRPLSVKIKEDKYLKSLIKN